LQKNSKLREIYEIIYVGNTDSLILDLKEDIRIRDVRGIPKPIPTYDPSDYMWSLYYDDGFSWLWHLKAIQADNAWDITKGDPNIKIAIIDSDFDLTHPDLSGQFDPTYDPYTGIPLSAEDPSHGTGVASFAAARTDGGGQLASIGFNCKMIGYTYSSGLAKHLHASNVMHADVISISWFNSCSPNSDDSLIINEILDNGTIIVASAGNGLVHCGGGEIYPFGSTYDDRLIKVTSTDRYDKHQYIVAGEDQTHSHYDGVDICAPGYCEMGAVPIINEDGSINNWPYYGCASGTSFATPIVAGVCALMKSINPCLDPAQTQDIIKTTADPVTDAYLYPGLVGSGRINAYEAVKKAGTRNIENTNLSSNQIFSGGYSVNLMNVLISNNATITLKARKEVAISGSFEVQLGSSLNVYIDETTVNDCN